MSQEEWEELYAGHKCGDVVWHVEGVVEMEGMTDDDAGAEAGLS